MPEQKQCKEQGDRKPTQLPLSFFACPNSDCAVNCFDADNSIVCLSCLKNAFD
jgi:hypothetical protein